MVCFKNDLTGFTLGRSLYILLLVVILPICQNCTRVDDAINLQEAQSDPSEFDTITSSSSSQQEISDLNNQQMCQGSTCFIPDQLELISQTGDCNGRIFRILNRSTNIYYNIPLDSPCTKIDFTPENGTLTVAAQVIKRFIDFNISLANYQELCQGTNCFVPYELNLISQTGDCNGMHFKFFNTSTNKYYNIPLDNPCAKINFSPTNSEASIAAQVITRFITYNIPLENYHVLCQGSLCFAPSDLQLLYQTGDCNGSKFRILNRSSNISYSIPLDTPCTKIDFTPEHGAPSVAIQVIQRFIDYNVPLVNYRDTRCDSWTNSSRDWRQDLENFKNNYDGSVRTFCFAPGKYTGSTVISNLHRTVLLAPDVGVHFQFGKVIVWSGTTKNHDLIADQEPTISFVNSSNVIIDNFEIENTNIYPYDASHKISRAVWLDRSSNITIQNSFIHSKGKQTITIDGTPGVRIQNSKIHCRYFCINANRITYTQPQVPSGVISYNNSYVIDDGDQGLDTHSLFWTWFSDMSFDNDTFIYYSGNAFVTGRSSINYDLKINESRIINKSETLTTLIHTHPNYSGLNLFMTGLDSPSLKYFECLTWINPGCSTGNEVGTVNGLPFNIFTRQTISQSYVQIPHNDSTVELRN